MSERCPNGLEHGNCLHPNCVPSCPGRLTLGWQPIETAPKDGTEVLGYWPRAVACSPDAYDVVRWHEGEWRDRFDDDSKFSAPSHWMPLPAPPALTQGQ